MIKLKEELSLRKRTNILTTLYNQMHNLREGPPESSRSKLIKLLRLNRPRNCRLLLITALLETST